MPKKRKLLILLCAFLALVLLTLVLGTLYLNSMLALIGREEGPVLSQSEVDALLQGSGATGDRKSVV